MLPFQMSSNKFLTWVLTFELKRLPFLNESCLRSRDVRCCLQLEFQAQELKERYGAPNSACAFKQRITYLNAVYKIYNAGCTGLLTILGFWSVGAKHGKLHHKNLRQRK